MEAADVRGPPRDAADRHVQPGTDLIVEHFERGTDIPGPDRGPESLTAGPRAAAQEEQVLFTFTFHAFIECFLVQKWIQAGHLCGAAEVEAHMFVRLPVHLRFAAVDPEYPETLPVIRVPDFLPEHSACVRVCSVVEVEVNMALLFIIDETDRGRRAAFGADQVSVLIKIAEIPTVAVERGPDRYHGLDAHFVQFRQHALNVRPAGFIKAEIAHARPVKEIDDDHREREVPAVILPRHIKKFFLRLVAQFALPEAAGPFRQLRGMAGGVGVLFHDLGGCIAGGYPVVELVGGFSGPAGDCVTEFNPADGGIVPQKPVPAAGHQERDGYLTVFLAQIQHTAFLIEIPVPVLA